MTQRPSPGSRPPGLHLGVIMDGNGRWALQRGLSRGTGHRAGAEAARRLVEAAPEAGIGVLTLFAFSSDNWRRPATEVAWLMRLFHEYLQVETARCVANGVRLEIIGRRDRLGTGLLRAVEAAEVATSGGSQLWLRVAVDYSSRDAILRAAQCLRSGAVSRESFGRLIGIVDHGSPVAELDLLIRTGGERRLSDFLLWEAAYAELYFTPVMWPDFGPEDLRSALRDFTQRERRFGGVPGVAMGDEIRAIEQDSSSRA
jgi:undecaprenyl diphosphate synthase